MYPPTKKYTSIAHLRCAGGSSRSQALEAQRAAAQSKQQAALDKRAAAQADREARQKEAQARKLVRPLSDFDVLFLLLSACLSFFSDC